MKAWKLPHACICLAVAAQAFLSFRLYMQLRSHHRLSGALRTMCGALDYVFQKEFEDDGNMCFLTSTIVPT